MKSTRIPESYNYIAAFLTFKCNMRCHYCINRYRENDPAKREDQMSADEWIQVINRIDTRPDLPVTLQGGEPTVRKDFYRIVNGIRGDINLDLLTNGRFNVVEFMKNIPPERMKRDAKYASIRFSYHPGYTKQRDLYNTVKTLQNNGYSVGIWAVFHPRWENDVIEFQRHCICHDIDFRLKGFLGEYNGKMYGEYKYPEAVDGIAKDCVCRPSELLISPNGDIHRCHDSVYTEKHTTMNMLDTEVELTEIYHLCNRYGLCNPCDIKTKFNRFQEEGHCSVNIHPLRCSEKMFGTFIQLPPREGK